MTKTLWNRSLRMAKSLGKRCAREDNWIEIDFDQMEKFIETQYAVKAEGDRLDWYKAFCAEHRSYWIATEVWHERYWWHLAELAGESWNAREYEKLQPSTEAIAERITTLTDFFWTSWEDATDTLTAFLEMCDNLSPTSEKEAA